MRLAVSTALATLAALAVAAGGCELVLGALPPLQGQTGGGATTSGSSGTGGVATTSSSSVAGASVATSSSSGTGGVAPASSSSGTGGACCDCDGDGYTAESCGGHDCDDDDKRAYPGEPLYYSMPSPNPAVGFDWDCSGTVDRDPSLNKTVTCPSLTISTCPTAIGYLAAVPPPCGQSGAWGTCTQQGTTCVNNVIDAAQVMTCK